MNRKFLNLVDGARSRRLSYLDWGDPDNPRLVLCVHGLTRNGRDFDLLAGALAGTYRVICPDVAGRGASDRLADPADYALPTYARDMVRLIEALGAESVDWIGTSMGGLIGMAIAGAADPGRTALVRRLVLNDVGPFLPKAALARIGAYVGQDWRFDSLDQAEAHMRKAYAPFGPLSDGQWRFLTEIGLRKSGNGFVPDYDPAIGAPFRHKAVADVDIWPLWEAIRCPTLVLRGADSDVLPAETAAEMGRRGPRAEVVEFDGIGHAPALLDDDQISPIRDWLARPR